jgi:hypothetical protein
VTSITGELLAKILTSVRNVTIRVGIAEAHAMKRYQYTATTLYDAALVRRFRLGIAKFFVETRTELNIILTGVCLNLSHL